MQAFRGKKALLFPAAGLVFLLFTPFLQPLHAQSAVKLETLLDTAALSWEQAEAFVREAAPTPLATDARQQWLPQNASPGDTARLNGIALLLMRSFDIKGGIFFRISESPHHAYRELVYKNVIRASSDPDMPVSGQQLLLMVNRLLALKEQYDG